MDWTGNTNSIFKTLGASSHCDDDRADNDFYATEPKAIELLLEKETFSTHIWECACGMGHLSKVLINKGYKVFSSDLVYRGYGVGGCDFLKQRGKPFQGDIVTNPPYKFAAEFVYHALDLIDDGHKVAMFLKIQFLEGKERRKLFDQYPPKKIYVFSSRMKCAPNGDFEKVKSSAVCYAWFIWEKGFTGNPIVDWIG